MRSIRLDYIYLVLFFITPMVYDMVNGNFIGITTSRNGTDSQLVSPEKLESLKMIAQYAGVGFCRIKEIQNWSCGELCQGRTAHTYLTKYIQQNKTDSSGFVALNPEKRIIIVQYRGTNSRKNWMNNVKFLKTPWLSRKAKEKGAKVHRGYLNIYKPLRDQINQELAYLLEIYPSYKVVFTGTSLGAVLAVMGMLDFREYLESSPGLWKEKLGYTSLKQIHTTCVGFGATRFGNKAFVNYAESLFLRHGAENYRVVNGLDIVVRSIPRLFGFYHMATEIWVKQPTELPKLCDSTNGEDPTCSNSIPFHTMDHRYHYSAWNISLRGCVPQKTPIRLSWNLSNYSRKSQ